MLLAVDVGNTESTLGLFDGDELRAHWRLTTTTTRTADEMRVLVTQLVAAEGLTPKDVTAVALCSVVPPATAPLVTALDMAFALTPLVVDASSRLPITLDVDEPRTVGADRVVNTLAASQIYRRDCIVVIVIWIVGLLMIPALLAWSRRYSKVTMYLALIQLTFNTSLRRQDQVLRCPSSRTRSACRAR